MYGAGEGFDQHDLEDLISFQINLRRPKQTNNYMTFFYSLQCVNHVTYLKSCVTLHVGKVINFVPGKYYLKLISNIMTNVTELKGNWNEQKGKLKKKFAVLTDNDLMFAEGKKEEMFGKLQIKLGKSKEELDKIIAAL